MSPTPDSLSSFRELSTACLVLSIVIAVYYFLYSQTATFELVNGKKKYELSTSRAKGNFVKNAYSILSQRLQTVPGKPFRVIADVGEVTILPPEYAHEIRNDERFSFTKAAYRVSRENLDLSCELSKTYSVVLCTPPWDGRIRGRDERNTPHETHCATPTYSSIGESNKRCIR